MQHNYAVIVPDLMDSELTEIEGYLPAHISYDSFVRCAKTSILNGGDILKAEKNSVIAALSKCAIDGLLPDNKEAAILSFNCNEGSRDKPNWVTKAQYLPMVDGIRSGFMIAQGYLHFSLHLFANNEGIDASLYPISSQT